MSFVNGAVYLEWSRTRSGLVVCGAPGARKPVPLDAVPGLASVRGVDVVVRHSDGPHLARAAVDAVAAGSARAAFIESDYGHATELTDVALATLTCWADRDPAGHPVDRVGRYAGGCRQALAAVAGNLFDPRWYADADRPDRHAALEARFGLTPRWDGRCSLFRECVTRAWRVDREPGPANFFTRMYLRKLTRFEPSKAERVVGRYFLKCVVAAWRDALAPRTHEPFFDPGALFDRDAVAAADPRNQS